MPPKIFAMPDNTINSLNCSIKSHQNYSQLTSIGKHKPQSSDNSSPNQSVTVLGLAVAVSSLGAIFTAPQIAQAAPTSTLVAESYSSILIAPSTPENNRAIAENLSPSTDQEENIQSSTIEIRSNIALTTDSATTVTVPKLPSLSLAQNLSRKTITKQIYTVRAGDTINSIARLYGITTDKILEANEIENPNQLSVNDRLVIPLEKSQTNKELNFVSSNPKFVPFSVTNPISARRSSNNMAQVVTRDISSDLSTSKDNVRDPYISRLRADIDQLRNQFQDQYKTESSAVSVNSSPSVINLESLEPNYSSRTISSVKPEEQNLTSSKDSSSEELLISSAVSPIDNYNKVLKSRIGETLQPQLPPLSSPEEYLPDNSNSFNGYIWPAQGTFTSGYGWRWGRMHRGIDIAAPIGTPIVAAATGEVIFAGWNSGGYGNLVKVKHPDNSVTLYAHNNKILVRQGQKVKQGQQIAEMGSTGYSTGPHLHFEIRTDGTTAVNPIALLPKK